MHTIGSRSLGRDLPTSEFRTDVTPFLDVKHLPKVRGVVNLVSLQLTHNCWVMRLPMYALRSVRFSVPFNYHRFCWIVLRRTEEG